MHKVLQQVTADIGEYKPTFTELLESELYPACDGVKLIVKERSQCTYTYEVSARTWLTTLSMVMCQARVLGVAMPYL